MANDAETLAASGRFDAALLLIPGIGTHARTSILFDMVDPLLVRLSELGALVDASALTLGDSAAPGGAYDALLISYVPVTGAQGVSDAPRRLLAVEGRWEDVFTPSPVKVVSSWAGRNAAKMMWELSVYIARGWRWLVSLAALALLLAGVALSARAPVAVALVLSSAFVTLWAALSDVWPDSENAATLTPPRRLLALTSAGTLAVYEIQRGFVLVVTLAGAVLLPLAAVVARWLASLPLMEGFGLGAIKKAEQSLLGHGIGDMETVADNHIASAAIHARLRRALGEIESRVAPGGTITVIGHSGGGPLAWWLLSEPEIKQREASTQFRYRLITVGAALNWAKHGFSSLATPLSEPLVNAQCVEQDRRTAWVNAFTAWDPAPHGPVAPADFLGWAAPPGAAFGPNRQMTNLGSPLSTEHSEYFRNQQEFVPELLNAIDPDLARPGERTATRGQLLSNLRFALVSPIVRLRMIVVAVPLAAITSMVRGREIICRNTDVGVYGAVTSAAGDVISGALSRAQLTFAGDAVCGNRFARDAVVAVVLLLATNALMDVYTNFFWQSLGRSARELRPARRGPVALPLGASTIVWLPTIVLPAILLFPFDLGAAYWVLMVLTLLLVALELLWLNECLLALDDAGRGERYGIPMGRRRDGIRHTPAAYSLDRRWPGLRTPSGEAVRSAQSVARMDAAKWAGGDSGRG